MNPGFSLRGIPLALRAQKITKEPIPHLASRRLDAHAFLARPLRHIVAVNMKFQIVCESQFGNELLIGIRLSPTQLVVEMNNRKHNPQLAPQLQQQTQQRHRINPARNGHTHAIPGPQQFLPPNVGKHALCQRVHRNMLAQGLCGDSRLGSGEAKRS